MPRHDCHDGLDRISVFQPQSGELGGVSAILHLFAVQWLTRRHHAFRLRREVCTYGTTWIAAVPLLALLLAQIVLTVQKMPRNSTTIARSSFLVNGVTRDQETLPAARDACAVTQTHKRSTTSLTSIAQVQSDAQRSDTEKSREDVKM